MDNSAFIMAMIAAAVFVFIYFNPNQHKAWPIISLNVLYYRLGYENSMNGCVW